MQIRRFFCPTAPSTPHPSQALAETSMISGRPGTVEFPVERGHLPTALHSIQARARGGCQDLPGELRELLSAHLVTRQELPGDGGSELRRATNSGPGRSRYYPAQCPLVWGPVPGGRRRDLPDPWEKWSVMPGRSQADTWDHHSSPWNMQSCSGRGKTHALRWLRSRRFSQSLGTESQPMHHLLKRLFCPRPLSSNNLPQGDSFLHLQRPGLSCKC
ncbi:uncharacterized protein LOC143686729 [Tamandua tetradactyla]|uniref:uncharacterized protein LOC143686729 n=1 Tax=Tamandua tetradactyla TaxID=48850 RepID=UPI0040542D15